VRVPALRAILFDAGNTLLRMDYAAIAAALGTLGVTTTESLVERAEWPARVRLDRDVFAPAGEIVSTEARTTHSRYLRYVLEGLGVRDAAVVEALEAWRRGYNQPVGLWNRAAPDAEAALRLARDAGLRTGVISNSNGTIRTVLGRVGLTPHLDVVLDSGEEGVEKPHPAIFERALGRVGVSAAEAAYIGDLYSIDVLGSRRVGLRAVLMDPGGHWDAPGCERAVTILDAVRLLVPSR
jgi:putative hydrolase of the HAD superfamily